MNKNKLIVCLVAITLVGIVLGTCLYVTIPVNFMNYISVDLIEVNNNITVDKTDSYLGHPDLLLNKDGRLITMYPAGHGRGPVITKHSDDFGETWSEREERTPKSWETSQETPTLYTLEFKNGDRKILLVSGCPKWADVPLSNGFNFSLSDDEGLTWSEFENVHSPMDCIVAMASLVHMKQDGEYIDKWMGVFHDHDYVNYKTYLTFNNEGKPVWSTPELLLDKYREIESKAGFCEILIFRGEEENNSNTLVLIARANKKVSSSYISISSDEGMTWSIPREVPYDLCGDRHKMAYDETTGLYVISFRQVIPHNKLLKMRQFSSYGWVAWVGDFNNLLNFATQDTYSSNGKAMLLLGKDYKGTADTGYSGIVCKDGDFCLVSYGYFKQDSKVPYIMSVKFNLKDLLKGENIEI